MTDDVALLRMQIKKAMLANDRHHAWKLAKALHRLEAELDAIGKTGTEQCARKQSFSSTHLGGRPE